MTRFLVITVLALASCSTLPELEENICGNLVLDPGETCDEISNRCEVCQLACEPPASPASEPTCEPGFQCGVDGFCHTASGAFGPVTSQLPIAALDLTVTDVDDDQIGDLLALTGSSISVTYGDASGQLETQTRSFAPAFRGFPAFGQLDADGSTDVLLSTPDGVVGYSSAHGVVAPHPFAIDLGTTTPKTCLTGQPFGVFSIDKQYLAVMIAVPRGGTARIDIGVIDTAGKDACPVQQIPICTISGMVNPMASQPNDVYQTSTVNPVSHVLALGTPSGACLANITRAPSATVPFTITPQVVASFPANVRPVLAELEGGGCPSLLMSTPNGKLLKEYVGGGVPGACNVATTPTNITLDGPPIPIGAQVVGHVRLEPPLLGLRRDAIVLDSGIYGVAQSRLTATELYRSDRPLNYVQAADLDGDGDLDAAAIGGGANFAVDGIDALYRVTTPLATTFLRVRSATRGPVSEFAVGDYDGNQVDDIVYTERVGDGERLSTLYGTHDRLLDPIEAGAFNQVVGLCPIQATDSSDFNEVIDDLVVIDLPNFMEAPLFTLLHGSPQRTMLSFYDPRVRVFGVPPSSTFTGVTFANMSRSAERRVDDVMAIETSPTTTRIWPAANSVEGLSFPSSTLLDGVAECGPGPVNTGTSFCTAGARYLAWPLPDRDTVIGIGDKGPNRTVSLDPKAFTGNYAPTPSNVLDGLDAFRLSSVYAVPFIRSLDTGVPDTYSLVASFLTTDTNGLISGGAVFVCSVDPQGVPIECQDVVAAAQLGDATCFDAVPASVTPVRIGSSPLEHQLGDEVILLCRIGGEVSLLRLFGTGVGVAATSLVVETDTLLALADAVQLRAGDVTGDGVDDLLALTSGGFDAGRSVLVIPQCTQSDLSCQGLVP